MKLSLKPKKDAIILITIIFFASIILLAPIIGIGYARGHDSFYHLASIKGIAELKISSLFNIKIIGTIFGNLGYGEGIFYPQLGHIIAAVIYKIIAPFGLSVFMAAKITHLLLLFLSGLFMFRLAYCIVGNYRTSLCAAIVYMALPYHLSDILIRDAFAEASLFCFIPMVGYSLYALSREKYSSFLINFVIGCIALINSHLLMTVIMALFFLAYVVLDHKRYISRKKIKYLILASVLVICMSLPFIIPLMQHKIYGDYIVFNDSCMVNSDTDSKAHISLLQLFNPSSNRYGGIVFAMNIVCVIVCAISLFRFPYIKNEHKRLFIILIALTLVCVLLEIGIVNIKLWPSFFHTIQFAWRLSVITCFTSSLLYCIAMTAIPRRHHFAINLACIICCLYGAIFVWNITKDDASMDSAMLANITKNYNEYLPQAAIGHEDDIVMRDDSIRLVSGGALITSIKNNMPNMTFHVETTGAILELLRIYYYGYEIYSIHDNEKREIPYEMSELGLMQIELNDDSTIVVRYTGGPLFAISKTIAVLAISTFVVFVYIIKRQNQFLYYRTVFSLSV